MNQLIQSLKGKCSLGNNKPELSREQHRPARNHSLQRNPGDGIPLGLSSPSGGTSVRPSSGSAKRQSLDNNKAWNWAAPLQGSAGSRILGRKITQLGKIRTGGKPLVQGRSYSTERRAIERLGTMKTELR